MIVLVALGGAVVVFLAVVLLVLVLFVLAMVSGNQAVAQSAGVPSPAALAAIPAELLPIYQESAEATCGMRWAVLAAIGKVETDHGRSTLPGVRSSENFAGAGGPMQFLQPTWNAYGVDGDGDGDKDRYDPVDAIWGAANYLCASGAGEPDRLRDAIFAYNHADWYVTKVLDQAAAYEAAPLGGADALALVNHSNLSLTPGARQDLLDGVIDQRVVDLLAWAVERHTISVSVLKTGHSKLSPAPTAPATTGKAEASTSTPSTARRLAGPRRRPEPSPSRPSGLARQRVPRKSLCPGPISSATPAFSLTVPIRATCTSGGAGEEVLLDDVSFRSHDAPVVGGHEADVRSRGRS